MAVAHTDIRIVAGTVAVFFPHTVVRVVAGPVVVVVAVVVEEGTIRMPK